MSATQTLAAQKTDRNVSSSSPEISYRLATTKDELEQAFSLVWQSYVRVGLEQESEAGVRLTKYHLLPDAKVFVAVEEHGGAAGKVIGTISVIPDGVLGLPAEKVAPEELIRIRREGKRAAEFVALAADDKGTKQRVTLKLFRLATAHCQQNGYTTILASLTQRHIGFYRRFLDFQPLGELMPYELGNGTPVQVHCMELGATSSLIEGRSKTLNRDPAWCAFWENEANTLLARAQRPRPWNIEMVKYFTDRSKSFAQQLDQYTVSALSSEYWRYGWQMSF